MHALVQRECGEDLICLCVGFVAWVIRAEFDADE